MLGFQSSLFCSVCTYGPDQSNFLPLLTMLIVFSLSSGVLFSPFLDKSTKPTSGLSSLNVVRLFSHSDVFLHTVSLAVGINLMIWPCYFKIITKTIKSWSITQLRGSFDELCISNVNCRFLAHSSLVLCAGYIRSWTR